MYRKENVHFGKLSRGCELCLKGLKSVLFITGLCNVNCFYCPISRERKHKDVIYINDVTANLITILNEIENSLSRGLAITGGEPTLVIDRLYELCRIVKREYGQDFHIHVYTNPKSWTRHTIFRLTETPIDELRLHIVDTQALNIFTRYLRYIKDCSFNVGLEVPVFPGWERKIVDVVDKLYNMDIIEFVNLNEVDITGSNINSIVKYGYYVDSVGSLKGSYEACIRVFKELSRNFPDLSIHVCSSITKDFIQIRLRTFMRSLFYASSLQFLQEDGTVERFSKGKIVREVLIGRSFKVFEEL